MSDQGGMFWPGGISSLGQPEQGKNSGRLAEEEVRAKEDHGSDEGKEERRKVREKCKIYQLFSDPKDYSISFTC